MPQETALIFISTSEAYWKYAQSAIDSARKFFPADILLFTDNLQQHPVAKQVQVLHTGWPNVTLMRYHTMLNERDWLIQYKHIFYLDVDMQVVAPVGDEILSDDISGCLHASFIGGPGTPEEDPRSTACLSKSQIRRYYTGCFIGGESKAFLSMAETISKNTDVDNANGFIATWHDESHLNRYLYDNPPAKELGVDYNAWFIKPSTKIFRIRRNVPNRPAVAGKQPLDLRNLP